MAVIGCDIDLTIVDTYNPWMKWFEEHSGGRKITNVNGDYDLVPEMSHILQEAGSYIDPFDYWRRGDLYDSLKPLLWSQSCLWYLKERGHKIVFISSCVPEHTASKIRFLDKYFSWRHSFIATHDKEFVDYDILIDDKLYHIQKGESERPDSRHILFTGIRTDGIFEHRSKYEQSNSWEDIRAKLSFIS